MKNQKGIKESNKKNRGIKKSKNNHKIKKKIIKSNSF